MRHFVFSIIFFLIISFIIFDFILNLNPIFFHSNFKFYNKCHVTYKHFSLTFHNICQIFIKILLKKSDLVHV